MIIALELISGVMLGFELFDDEDSNDSYFILDLLVLRVLFCWSSE